MVDNKHCPDHVKIVDSLARIETGIEHIKGNISSNKNDVRWFITTSLATIAVFISLGVAFSNASDPIYVPEVVCEDTGKVL